MAVEIHETGLELDGCYGLSILDAMIDASGLPVDCDTLWSEETHDSMVIRDRLRVAARFAPAYDHGSAGLVPLKSPFRPERP